MKYPTTKGARWQVRWLPYLICLAATVLFPVLWAHAQTDAILPPIGGPGGGQFVARCPQGQFLTGVELHYGDDVDAIKVICVTAYGPADVGPPVTGGEIFGGSGGGEVEKLVCPKENPVVTGMYVNAWGEETLVVGSIGLYCGTAATTQVQRESFDVLHSGAHTGGASVTRSEPKRAKDSQRCPTSLVAVGINGRSGVWLDAVGLICGVPTLTPKGPEPVKAVGRVKVVPGTTPGSAQSICDSAREARARNSPAAPGLEAQCRAAGAAGETPPVKAVGRVKVTPGTTSGSAQSICDSAREARARNSPAAPGLEEKCRAAGAGGETPPAIVADTNPVTVPKGQASGATTISWKTGPEYTYCEIYLSIDDGEWSEFARGGDGAKLATIKLGGSYTFRMMVYEGQAGTPKIIKTFTVTARN